MAFSVRLTGFSVSSGKPIFLMEPSWWPANELRQDPRMKETITDGYLDYQATVSVEEAREMHKQFRAAASRGVFGSPPWQNLILPMLAELDAALGDRSAEFGQFEIRVFEWESGLEET